MQRLPGVHPWTFHRRVQQMYDWNYVAERTEIVYNRVMESEPSDLSEKLSK